MLHSGCVKLHQKFRDFVGLPMGLLREESPKNRMNTGLFGSRSGSTASKPPVARLSSPSAKKVLFSPENFGFPGFSLPIVRILKSVGSDFRGNRPQYVVVWQKLTTIFEVGKVV